MNHSGNHRQLPLGPFPGQPTQRLYECVVESLRPRQGCFLVRPSGDGFMRVSIGER
jgi:hypothetical protein